MKNTFTTFFPLRILFCLCLALTLNASALGQNRWHVVDLSSLLQRDQTTVLNDVSFLDADHGIIVGYFGKILVTSDGGQSWSLSSSGTSETLRSVDYFAQNRAIIVGENGTLLSTTDAGASWQPIASGTTDRLHDVQFTSDMVGWITGGINGLPSTQTLLKTTDGGATWSEVVTPFPQQPLYGHHFLNDNEGCVVGLMVIAQTSDGGQSWIERFNLGATYFEVYFLSADIGFSVSRNGVLRRTDTAGQTWPTVWNEYSRRLPLNDIDFVSETEGWAVGEPGSWGPTLLHTTDGGLTWVKEFPDAPLSGFVPFQGVDMLDANNGWAVATGEAVLHWGPATTAIEELPEEVVLDVQVFPNPLHDRADISFTTRMNGSVSIDVFDLLGRRVEEMVTDVLSPGTHTHSLQLEGQASGTYIVRVRSGAHEVYELVSRVK